MKPVINFFTKYKYVIIWSACYILFMWAILQFMFNFNMFVIHNWVLLAHAHLRGFPGFVFGILILSALPIYIATTSIIIRTKKPLFVLSIPKFMQPVKEETTKTTDQEQSKEPEQDKTEEKAKETQQKIIPTELRQAFVRARLHLGPAPKSNFDITNIPASTPQAISSNEPELQSAGELPLPTDFDIKDETPETNFPSFSPVFSDVTFDDTEPEELDIENNTDNDSELKDISEHLNAKGIKFRTENGLILTDQDVIAAHIDPDFWIADEETWFAAGKQKDSPVNKLLQESKKSGLKPILYLSEKNILDIDSKIPEWEKEGIKIITKIDDIN